MRRRTQREINADPTFEHHLHVCVPPALREELRALARKYDRTTADIVRTLMRIGVPLMRGFSEAEQVMIEEYSELFQRLKQVKSLKNL
jgi:hypothetical protein